MSTATATTPNNSKGGKIKPVMRSNFDFANKQHQYILSLCQQYGWQTHHKNTGRDIADLKKLNAWMHTNKCPVQKPLLKMTKQEVSKVIVALEQMVTKKY